MALLSELDPAAICDRYRIFTDEQRRASLELQWPHAVETINENGRSPIVLICEHASNHIPAEYAGLGLDASEVTRHIAWDIGAANLTVPCPGNSMRPRSSVPIHGC